MRVTFTGKTTAITDREREYAEKKLQRLARYFNTARDAHLTHSVQRNWQIVEVQMDLNGIILRAEERTPDFFASVDAIVEKLEQQLKRLKGKLRGRKGQAAAPVVAAALTELPEAEVPAPEEAGPTVVRRKHFAIKPMTVDEASLQLDLLNHDFFLFLNDETGEVNVLYRRKDGNLGLLEVET